VAIYEVLLERPSGRYDRRFTDQPLPLDEPFELEHGRWRVERMEPPEGSYDGRYVCKREPASASAT
jgi:hypothetical protein